MKLWVKTKHLTDANLLTTNNMPLGCSENMWITYRERVIKLCPSDDLLCDIFLKAFENQKTMYEKVMCETTATSLMADHTFKVCIH